MTNFGISEKIFRLSFIFRQLADNLLFIEQTNIVDKNVNLEVLYNGKFQCLFSIWSG